LEEGVLHLVQHLQPLRRFALHLERALDLSPASGILDGDGAVRGDGLEDAHVLAVESIDTELGQDHDADEPLAEDHRGPEDRLIEVRRSGDRQRVGIVVRIRRVVGLAGEGNVAGEASPDGGHQGLERLALVLGELSPERDGRERETVRLQHVDPTIVVIDQTSELSGDRLADLLDAGALVELGGQRMQHPHLGALPGLSRLVWPLRSGTIRLRGPRGTSACCRFGRRTCSGRVHLARGHRQVHRLT